MRVVSLGTLSKEGGIGGLLAIASLDRMSTYQVRSESESARALAYWLQLDIAGSEKGEKEWSLCNIASCYAFGLIGSE